MSFAKLTTGKKLITGRTQSSEKTFASVPGLVVFLEPPFGLKVDTSNRVSRQLDLSGNENDATNNTLSSQPILKTLNGLDAIDYALNKQLNFSNSSKTRLKFLHDGTPHGIFFIHNLEGLSLSGTTNIIRDSGSSVVTGYNVGILTTRKVRRFIGSSVATAGASVFHDTTSVLPTAGANFIGSVYNGYLAAGDDHEWYINGAKDSGSNSIKAPDTSEAPSISQMGTVAGNQSGSQHLMLIYNWSGTSQAQRDAYVADIFSIGFTLFDPILP